MKRVYKYTVTQQGVVSGIPINSLLLCVQVQNENVVLYALVDERLPKVDLLIDIVTTGSQAPENKKYLGTLMMFEGSFVVHFFGPERS